MPTRPFALLFPGQGSQAVGMGRRIYDASSQARSVFERADRALGIPLTRACFEGPAEALRLTATTQPAILTTSVALLESMRQRRSVTPSHGVVCAAGHSLGEYSALVAAGALEFEDAVRIVRRRGEYMQEAVPDGEGAMAAVLGAPLSMVQDLCREAGAGEVLSPANLNAPDQTVVAGSSAAVERLTALGKTRGIRRMVRLPVSAPFHCELMAPARTRLAEDLRDLPLRDAAIPVIPNVSARPERQAEVLRSSLEQQVTAAVRWVETIQTMRAIGVEIVVEIGPGRVLGGLAKRIEPELLVLNVEDPESLEAAVAQLDNADSAGGRS